MTEHPTPHPASTASDASVAVETPPAFNADVPHATPDRPISAVARRALTEAAERRAADEQAAAQEALKDAAAQVEHGGPRGPEPTRYGDWEKKGLAVDF